MYFGKISKFPVFSMTGIPFCHFPCFPCVVGTLLLVPLSTLNPLTGDGGQVVTDPGPVDRLNVKLQVPEGQKVKC